MSALEALCNAVIGLLVSWAAQLPRLAFVLAGAFRGGKA